MDYRDIFGINRPRRRRRSRLTRSGEPVDLLQLMRRRVRYRPYALNRLRSNSREMNFTNYDNNLSQNLNFLPDNQSSNRDVLSLYGNVECKDVSTNTEYPCCSGASTAVVCRSERPAVAAGTSSTNKTPNLENRRKQKSTVGVVKSVAPAAQTQSEKKSPNNNDSNTNREGPAISTKDFPVKSNSNSNVTAPEVKSVASHQRSSSSTVTDSTDISSDTVDESSHNSSLVVEPNTSGESLNIPTPPTIAYIEVHHSSSQEHITTSDSSLNNVIRSLPLIGPVDGEDDAEAGGDGHHNDSVLQFEITLTTAVPDIDDLIENDEEDEHNDEDDDNDNEIEDNDNEIDHNDDDDDNENDDNDNEIDDNDNEEVEEEEQGGID